MVCMIVCHKDMPDCWKCQTILSKILFYKSYSYSSVYHQPFGLGKQEIAVAATTTPKGDKFQHYFRFSKVTQLPGATLFYANLHIMTLISTAKNVTFLRKCMY